MRVAVAEDGALFREGLALLLQAAGHEVAGCYPDGDALISAVAADPVDVAILDIRMPPGADGGLQTAERLRALRPDPGILLLSHYAATHYLMRVLGDTLYRIAAGEIVIEPVLARRLVKGGAGQAGSALASLSERETDVLRLMAEGRANNAIAGELYISAKAVEKHVAAIFTKLGLPGDATVHHRRVLAVLAYLQANRIDGATS